MTSTEPHIEKALEEALAENNQRVLFIVQELGLVGPTVVYRVDYDSKRCIGACLDGEGLRRLLNKHCKHVFFNVWEATPPERTL